jgi:hypothetical protein
MRIASRIRSAPRASELAVYSGLETHGHVALRGKIVDFVGLRLLDDTDEAGGVRQVAVVQEKAHPLLVRIAVEVVNAIGIEQTGAALDAVNDVALAKQEFCEVRTVLAGDAGDEGDFGLFCHSAILQGCAT